MTTQSERIDFITRFRDQFPARDREECIKAAGQLLRLARTYQRLSEEECSGPGDYIHRIPYPSAGVMIEQWEASIAKRLERWEAKIYALCAAWDIPVTLGGDPRGYTVKVHFPDGRGNTWGGDADGYGVPA